MMHTKPVYLVSIVKYLDVIFNPPLNLNEGVVSLYVIRVRRRDMCLLKCVTC